LKQQSNIPAAAKACLTAQGGALEIVGSGLILVVPQLLGEDFKVVESATA